MEKCRGAIFDLDGTLLDSMGVWTQLDIDFLGKRGIPVPEDYLAAVTPMGFSQAAQYTIERFALNETPEALIAEWNAMAIEAYRTSVFLKPGAAEYLQALKGHGVKLAVATASHAELYVPALEHNGVLALFDAFTTLSEVSRGKGFPDIYLKAAQKLGLSPAECVVFEDIYAGILGAKAGGFCTAGVYDASSESEQNAIRQAADFYLKDFTGALALPVF